MSLIAATTITTTGTTTSTGSYFLSSSPTHFSAPLPQRPRHSTYTCTRRQQPFLASTSSFHSQRHRNDAFQPPSKSTKMKKLSLLRALPFDLSPPPIDHDHEDTVTITDDGTIAAFHADDDDVALDAAQNAGAVVDLSHYGRIRVGGEDRIQFLHNQSTANFECLNEGQGCDTVFVTPTARTIDIAHAWIMVNGMPLTVAVGNVVSEEGFSMLMSPNAAGTVWKALISQGATAMGSGAWETLRILQGRPAPGKELTDEFNVLEAGLWNAVSLNKGCYKGQETISRLVTYDGVKQRLWGIRLSSLVEAGSAITIDGKKVGKLTSITVGKRASEPFGLGYVKRKAASKGHTVIVGDNAVGTVVEVPFLAQQHPPSKNSTP